MTESAELEETAICPVHGNRIVSEAVIVLVGFDPPSPEFRKRMESFHRPRKSESETVWNAYGAGNLLHLCGAPTNGGQSMCTIGVGIGAVSYACAESGPGHRCRDDHAEQTERWRRVPEHVKEVCRQAGYVK